MVGSEASASAAVVAAAAALEREPGTTCAWGPSMWAGMELLAMSWLKVPHGGLVVTGRWKRKANSGRWFGTSTEQKSVYRSLCCINNRKGSGQRRKRCHNFEYH